MEYVLDVRHIHIFACGELSSLTAGSGANAYSSTVAGGEARREEPTQGLRSRRKWR